MAALALATPAWAQGKDTGFGGLPSASSPSEMDGSKMASVTLIAERTSLAPGGEPSWIAARFRIEPKWHLYWLNPGEAGMPPGFAFEAPEGVSIGDPVFPAPKRHRLPSGGVEYIYEDELVVLFPVEVAGGFSGGSATITVDVEWLICKDLCLPGDGEATLTVPVGGVDAPSEHAGVFQRTLGRVPAPATMDSGLIAAWSGDSIVVGSRGASRLTVYPYPTEAFVEPVNTWADGSVAGDRLTLGFRGDLHEIDALRVVVERESADGATELLDVEIPRPATSRGAVE